MKNMAQYVEVIENSNMHLNYRRWRNEKRRDETQSKNIFIPVKMKVFLSWITKGKDP